MANPLSPISYTNKDFNSIYEEILTLAKQLSEKWDPTVSNESDPGVVLLKTDAIIGDKNNYNIDKNILEAFPQTVTQDVNARNMYKQLAYYMPWYKSSETVVTVKYLGEPLLEGEEFQIPAYTMVCNSDSNTVYTLTQPLTFNYTTNSTTSNAIEGTINDLRVNGSNTITLENLDVNNRVYFDDYSVAENGIFIVNVNSQDKRPWKRVDNLLIQPLNTKCFEFGVDSRTETCYIEFPQDIANLIESGLSIKYILSNGSLGNVAAQTLEKFYQETTVELNGNPLPLNNENFKLANFSAAVSGSDPQSISDAYLSYKKQATLLNTLVTTQDYANALYNSGLVSNVIVSDRTNDLQTSYIVMTDDKVNPEHLYQLRLEDIYSDLINELDKVGSEYTKSGEAVTLGDLLKESLKIYSKYISEPLNAMNAFDLKLYLLQNSGTISNIQQYENTFELVPIEFTASPVYNQISNFIANQKCVQHDFKQLLVDTPCMYQNSYPIIMKIVPTGKLTEAQISELKVNIIKSLYNVTSAHHQEFGVEPDYDLIYNTIKNADERIQTLILDDFRYTTYAVYWDSSTEEFKRIPVNTTELDATNMVVKISTVADLANYKGKTNQGWNTTRLNSTLFLYTSDEILTENLTGYRDYLDYGNSTSIKKNTIFIFDSTLNKFIIYSDKLSEFQKDLIVKNIMAGITPLYIPNTNFNISLSDSQILQTDTGKITTVSVISPYSSKEDGFSAKEVSSLGNVSITIPTLPESELTTDKYASTYTMKDNENIRLFGPSFTSEKVFANYAKFILQLNEDSGITRYNPILLSSDLQPDKTYYTTLDGWRAIAKNAIEFYNQRFDTEYGAPDTNLYTVLTKWVDSICKFLGMNNFTWMTTTYSWGDTTSNTPPEGVVFPDRPSIVEFEESQSSSTYTNIEFIFSTEISVTDSEGTIITTKYDKTVSFKPCHITIDNTTAPKNGSWKYNSSNDPYYYSGKIMVDYVTSGSVITQNIDPYDPIIASFNQKLDNPNINEISIFDQVTTYTIPAETEYQLKENESITFFWRESDGDDVPYRYQRYVGISKNSETSTKKSPILKSTFALKGEPISSSFLDSLSSSGELLDGAPGWDKVVKLYGDNDLSGSRSIDMRKINQVILDRTDEGTYQNKNKIYFISNTNTNDKYYLQIPLVSTSTVESKTTYSYRYTLQDNEFFIYTMDNGTSFEMLSAGTLIGIDTQTDKGDLISFDVDAVSTEDIITKGISSFLAKTEYIPQEYTMFCREQKIYSIVGGDQVHFNIEDLDAFLNANSGVNKLYDLGTVNGVPYFCTWADTYVKGFSMNYTSSGTEITLPRLEIQDDNDCIWVGRSYLNMRTSPQKAQEIIAAADNSTQSIIINGTVYPENVTNGGPSNGFESPEGEVLKIRSSIDLDKVGGENVDLTYLDMLGERNDVSLYLYETLSEYTEDPYYITDNNVVEVRMNAGDLTKYTRNVSFNYEAADRFIFSITNTSKKCSFKLYITTSTNNNLSDAWKYNLSNRSDSPEFLGEGIYYFNLPQDTTKISFVFNNTEDNFEKLSSEPTDWNTNYKNYYTLDNGTYKNVEGVAAPEFESDKYYKANDTETLKISPLEKTTLNSVFNEYSIEENTILDAIKSYDYKGIFKYDYIPDNETRILDPLKSNTFFELQHVANRYTIPKCVLKISSATDSNISIVNNR